jgi:hypothetical protein
MMKTYPGKSVLPSLGVGIKLLTIIIFFAVSPLISHAQWNDNTSVNIQISSLTLADMQSASTTDGKTWIAFYVENGSNYDMRAQLIDANGYKLLGPDGMLVSNEPSGTSTYVFNVCVDASNNLIIAYQDLRSSSPQAVLYKISEAGTQLWGSTGVVIGPGLSPYPAVLSTGEVVVAWIGNTTLQLQKVTASGTLAWSTPISIMVGSSATTRGQVIANTAGKFSMVYQKGSMYTTLYAQQFDNSGTALYGPLQICNQTTAAYRYYSIAAEADTTYFGYYSSVGNRFNSFLQRINPGGSIPYGMNGSNFNTSVGTTDNYQGTTCINITPGSSYVWSVCTFSDPNQTVYGVYIQKFLKATGGRQFTDAGKVVYPINSSTYQQCGDLALMNDTPMFMSYDVNYKIYATRLDANGNFAWPLNSVEISSTTSTVGKMRYGFTPDGPNRCAGVWDEQRTSAYLGYAQGISIGGLIGIKVATQGNVPATIPTPGGTLQMVDTIFPTVASQNATWSIIPVTGLAAISASGLVTASANGTVYAKAIAAQDITVKDSLLITITGQAPLPPSVTTLPATSITGSSATLNGSVMANNGSTSVSFNWGLTVSYGNTVTATPATVTSNTPTPVLANISGLAASTTYHFRCVGVNSAGTTYGSDLTFMTCQPAPGTPGTITGLSTVCQNQNGVTYSISPVSNATSYSWTVPSGASITAGSGTTAITVDYSSSAVSGNITVAGVNSCASGPTASKAVTVNTAPSPTISGPTSPCISSSNNNYTTESGMNNYIWTITAGGNIVSGTGTNSIIVHWTVPGAQTLSVTYTNSNGCQPQSPTMYYVTVNDIPAASDTISGSHTVCAGTQGLIYSVPIITGALSYVWTVPSGATIVSGNNTNTITVDFSNSAVSGNMNVHGSNSCGDGTTSPDFAITVNTPPTGPIVTNTGTTLFSSAPAGNQWFYQGTLLPGATAQSYVATQTGYYWDVVTINSCSSDTSNHKLIVITGIDPHSSPVIEVYPVPNDGRFNVSITSTSRESFSIKVYNNLGINIYEETKVECNGSLQKVIDLRPVPSGVYTIIFEDSQKQVTRKIVVSK